MGNSTEPALSKICIVSHVYPQAQAVYPYASGHGSVCLAMAMYPCACGSVSMWLCVNVHVAMDTHAAIGMCYGAEYGYAPWPAQRVWLCTTGWFKEFGDIL